jgi:hypothetical protein
VFSESELPEMQIIGNSSIERAGGMIYAKDEQNLQPLVPGDTKYA